MIETQTSLYSITSLADRLGGEVVGCNNLEIKGINSIQDAGENDITFVINDSRLEEWINSTAGAAVATRGLKAMDFNHSSRALIMVDNAEIAMIDLLTLFSQHSVSIEEGIHPTAAVAKDVQLGKGVAIGPHVSIQSGVKIGDGVIIHSGVSIYPDVCIGDHSVLHANVVIRDRCVIGRGVIMHSGVAIGTDGFGYRPAPDGAGILKVPHVGNVIIEDAVEIGANSTIDRGKFSSTIIGAGTKIDNLVHIGHSCRIGRCCLIAGLVGFSGSVTVGDGVQFGGNAVVAEHVKIGDGARIGGKTGVIADIEPGADVFGYIAGPAKEELRQIAIVRRLRDWMKTVSSRLDRLEK